MSYFNEPTRDDIDRSSGVILLEFGTDGCGHCRSLRSQVTAILDAHPDVDHLKVEDGPGRPLGRSFAVKLWPTLVLLRDGVVLDRIVRPSIGEVRRMFARLNSPTTDQSANP